jgi:hypothetical protein
MVGTEGVERDLAFDHVNRHWSVGAMFRHVALTGEPDQREPHRTFLDQRPRGPATLGEQRRVERQHITRQSVKEYVAGHRPFYR